MRPLSSFPPDQNDRFMFTPIESHSHFSMYPFFQFIGDQIISFALHSGIVWKFFCLRLARSPDPTKTDRELIAGQR